MKVRNGITVGFTIKGADPNATMDPNAECAVCGKTFAEHTKEMHLQWFAEARKATREVRGPARAKWGYFANHPAAGDSNPALAIKSVVWQKFHILSRAQVFVITSVCAVVIAFSVALASIPADGTSWYRFLGPSRQFDPFINFGLVFVSVLPVFLGYYHLSRIGAFLGLAMSALTLYLTGLCAMFLFTFQVVGCSEVLEVVAYVGFCLLLSTLFFFMHMKMSNSRTVQNAQRSLRLVPPPQTP